MGWDRWASWGWGEWEQEGQWQGARWGRGSGGKEGQMAGKGGDGRVQKGQMAVTGVVGYRRVAGSGSSRWGQPVTRSGGKGQ